MDDIQLCRAGGAILCERHPAVKRKRKNKRNQKLESTNGKVRIDNRM
jgi:hypothetical protein